MIPRCIEAAAKNFDEAVDWLREQAKARHPQSSYTRKLLRLSNYPVGKPNRSLNPRREY